MEAEAITIYDTLSAFLSDPAAPERPHVPPGGCCGHRDNSHMTFLAMTIRKTRSNTERLRKLQDYAVLLEQVAPGDPCVGRVMSWHRELIGAR
ncbi:hypothetical protein [Pararhizobium haloflavum]|uniref:hypothetical protein n=1 Tax=Pararhizobium haloflavum TaxID=2037914 RepID=UPI000C17D635|nr:hypothetical protein [Pararhizobium haloflavum]